MGRCRAFLYVIDTFAWIEYFAGSERGARARSFVEREETITPSVVIAEFADKYAREGLDPAARLAFIRNRSRIADLDYRTAELAGRVSAERRRKVDGWGLVDSVVLATAMVVEGKVVTGDRHFGDLPQAIMIS